MAGISPETDIRDSLPAGHIKEMTALFGNMTHLHGLLGLSGVVNYKIFRDALKGMRIPHAQMMAVRDAWALWRTTYLLPARLGMDSASHGFAVPTERTTREVEERLTLRAVSEYNTASQRGNLESWSGRETDPQGAYLKYVGAFVERRAEKAKRIDLELEAEERGTTYEDMRAFSILRSIGLLDTYDGPLTPSPEDLDAEAWRD